MLFNIDKKPSSALAAIAASGGSLTYGDIVFLKCEIKKIISQRELVFCLCENKVGALAGFLSLYDNKDVCLLLSANIDSALLDNLVRTYSPSYFWLPQNILDRYPYGKIYEYKGYCLCKTGLVAPEMNQNLSMLMTTSGTTGSPKLVRHKYGNIESNAENVAKVFEWTSEERGIMDLPMQYTMGLNVITSHLYAGACILLISANLMTPHYWSFIKEQKGTNFTGVPFSYEILNKLRFTRMDLPYLSTIAEGGGKLSDNLFSVFANYAEEKGKRFFATFGTTETSARLAFLPPSLATKKCGSIGKAIPQGKLTLIDEDGNEITESNIEGELIYEGPNVTLGYAECVEDLTKGDEFCGVYHTGDIARCDDDGCYYIVGRKKRFLKLFGLRVSLDQTERIIFDNLNIESACSGDDSKMLIYITDENAVESTRKLIADKTGLSGSSYKVICVKELIRNESGKIKYKELDRKYGILNN